MITWLQFSLWLIGFYTLYYLSNILFDVLYKKQPDSGGDPAIHELSFIEDQLTQQVSLERPKPKKEIPPVIPSTVGLGGVSLKTLFHLARTEAIEVPKPIIF